MLKYMENLYEVSIKRKNACSTKNNVMYVKWAFPIARGGLNPTYSDKINKTTLKNILTETQDYRTALLSSVENLHKKYPTELRFVEKAIVYGLEQKTPFATTKRLTFQTVKTKEDLRLWGRIASKIYDSWDTDSIYESFKTDLGKKYATYFIFYKGKTPVTLAKNKDEIKEIFRKKGVCEKLFFKPDISKKTLCSNKNMILFIVMHIIIIIFVFFLILPYFDNILFAHLNLK